MIMFMLKNKTHIEVFPDIHIVEEYNNNEFKSSIKKNNMIYICSRRHKCKYSIEKNKD